MKWLRSRASSAIAELQAGAQGDGASNQLPVPNQEPELAEMTFLEHLEELRWSILKGLGALLFTTIIASIFRRWIIDTLLMGPTRPSFFMYRFFGIDAKSIVLQNRTITGQFFADWGTVLVVGLIIGSPAIIYFLWKFIEPGLYQNEKKGMRFAAVFATFFFILGILFGYLVITPLALQFFANYSISDSIINEFDITRYFSMVTFWAFGVGVLFELPVVVFFLSKVGLLNARFLRTYRKYALIIVLILGAILTPPDPISQILVAMPLMLLYELSIYISGYVNRKQERELREALK